MNEKPRGQFWSCQPDASLTGKRPDIPTPFQVLQKPDDVLPEEECKPGRMQKWFRRNMAIPALRGAIAVLKSTCWKPGDPITRFSTSWEEVIGEPDTDDCDEEALIDVSGGTMTPFTPEEERQMLEYLEANRDKYGPEAFKKSESPCD